MPKENFETFFAALMANVERKSGLDMSSPRFHVVLNAEDLKSMLRETWRLAFACGQGENE